MALGGLGEIGRNMAVLEFAGQLLVIDCGVLFPEAEQPGVDLILPDFGVDRAPARRHRRRRPHPRARGPHRRGALPAADAGGHPAGRLPVHPGAGRGQAARAPHRARCWSRSPRATTTSRGRSTASSSRSTTRSPTRSPSRCTRPAGTLVHTGDFKMDQLPLDGVLTDLGAFARLGRRGHRPAAVGLHQRRGARLRHPRAQHRAGAGRGVPPGDPAADRLQLRQPRAPHPAGPRRRRACTAARSRSSAARWSATWAWPATWGCCTSRPGCMVSLDEAAAMPPEQVVLI